MGLATADTRRPTSTEVATPDQRPTWVLRIVLVAAVLASIGHYGDNYLRFDDYPPADDGWVTRSIVWQAWVLYTAAAAVAYVAYRRGRAMTAAAFLAIYATAGLISPLHYFEAPLSTFDAVQHTFIVGDLLAGLAVLAFAVWLVWGRVVVVRRPSAPRL